MKTVSVNWRTTFIAAIGLGTLLLFIISILVISNEKRSHASFGHKIALAKNVIDRRNAEAEREYLNQQVPPPSRNRNISSQSDILLLPHRTHFSASKQNETDNNAGLGDDDSDESRREFVRAMMLHAWSGYKRYAWGANEVRPISKIPHTQGIFGGQGSGLAATIVDSLDTLLIMGLSEQYEEARDYIRDNFNISRVTGTLSVFETNIRFLGGLLSAYAITNEDFYVNLSKSIAEVLLKAFNTPTSIPKSSVNPSTGEISNYGWAEGGSSILSEFGSLHLEFAYLSKVTSNLSYKEKVQKIRDHLDKIEKIDGGLYPNYMSPETGEWMGSHVSLGAMGDSFYEYLLKSYILTNRTDAQAWRMYTAAMDAVQEKMIRKSKGGLWYVAESRNGILEHKMSHLSCFCVGMFALQSKYETSPDRARGFMRLAEELGRTCHESYVRSKTGIGPEVFSFVNGNEAKAPADQRHYILRPEVIEGWFYLWRLTGKPMYKEWVWRAVQAIETYCRREAGYTGITNVYSSKPGSDDVQQSYFLAETLKYAYLTFTNSSVMSLDKWVFNTEAHPLPIWTGTGTGTADGTGLAMENAFGDFSRREPVVASGVNRAARLSRRSVKRATNESKLAKLSARGKSRQRRRA